MGEPTGWLGYVEPFATAAAVIVAVLAALYAQKSAALQERETERQGRIALESMLIDYHGAIIRWADECLDQMGQAISLTFFDPDKTEGDSFFNRRSNCIWHLSALLDRGRLLFPNEAPDRHGGDKPGAFRGFRPVVLDQIKYMHDHVRELRRVQPEARSPEHLRSEMVKCKRQFVTEVQRVVDPRAREDRLKQILLARSARQGVDAATRT